MFLLRFFDQLVLQWFLIEQVIPKTLMISLLLDVALQKFTKEKHKDSMEKSTIKWASKKTDWIEFDTTNEDEIEWMTEYDDVYSFVDSPLVYWLIRTIDFKLTTTPRLEIKTIALYPSILDTKQTSCETHHRWTSQVKFDLTFENAWLIYFWATGIFIWFLVNLNILFD